jgi:hypothetical protein
MTIDELEKLRQFDIKDTEYCSAFCPYVQSNYCRLYKVELVSVERCKECFKGDEK